MRNRALEAIAREIESHVDELLTVNAADVAAATAEGLRAPLLSRLKLTRAKCAGMAEGLRSLAAVSYTHLDVYKRQGAGRMMAGLRTPTCMMLSMVCCMSSSSVTLKAVSYTHLDVYKRQFIF